MYHDPKQLPLIAISALYLQALQYTPTSDDNVLGVRGNQFPKSHSSCFTNVNKRICMEQTISMF